MFLTPEEESTVRDTWAILASDMKRNGALLFIRLFTDYPEYQKLFRAFANVPLDQLPNNKRLQAHGFTVMNSINGMVDNLDDLEVLTELLVKTGQNHQRRKLKIADFQNLNTTFLDLFSETLGPDWTSVAATGWNKVLKLMTEKIGEGLDIVDE